LFRTTLCESVLPKLTVVPPAPFTTYGIPFTLSRSYDVVVPRQHQVRAPVLERPAHRRAVPTRRSRRTGGWCMITTLNGALDPSIFVLSHCACFELALRPSGSRGSLLSMKKWIEPLRTS
jgi:hypothetical protein